MDTFVDNCPYMGYNRRKMNGGHIMNVKKGMKFITLLLAVMVCISMPIDKFVINEVIPMSTVEAASIKLNKKTATVVIGKKVTLKVSGTKKKVSWASTNKSVATVTAKGVVTGKKAGTATIKAKVSGKTLKCKITVKESPKLSSTKCSMFWGTTKTLKVTGTNKKVKWTTSDSSIVTVTKQGKLTAKKSGKATVAATVGSKKLKCTVTVKNRITVSTNAITIEEGKTYNLKVKYVGDGTISWKCGNTDIVQPSWKEGWEGNYTTLKIKGLEAGKTTVALVNTLNNEKVRIKVTVKEKDPRIVHNENFDDIVQYVKARGKFSTYGGYCTYGYVSVSLDGSTIEFYEGHNRRGHSIKLTRGSYTAEATVNLKLGYATAEFDIRTFKGDCSDSLNWDNDPSWSNAMTYDAAVANILKNISNYDFYINNHSLKDIGFTSYFL